MNRLFLVFLALFCKITVCNSQVVDIVWEKSFGGFSGDVGNAICEAVDSGYVFVAYSSSADGDLTYNAGASDIWVVHTDVDGNFIWQKTFGGSSSEDGLSIISTIDSGFLIAGRSTSSDGDVGINYGNNDCWIIKLNSDGDLLWQKVIGGSSSEEAKSIIQTLDGGYMFTGYSNSDDGIFSDHIGSTENKDLIVVKLNAIGEAEWSKSYGYYGDDRGYKIIQTADSNYVVAGYTDFWGDDTNYWLIKIDPEGNLLWEKDYGGSEDDFAYAVAEINPDRIVVVGEAKSYDGDITEAHGSNDAWIIMMNATGDLIWENALGGSSNETGSELLIHADGSITVAGKTGSDNNGDVYGHQGLPGHSDYWLINLDTSGVIRWQKCLGGTETDFANAALLGSDSSILLTGYAWSDDGDVSGHHGEPGPFYGSDAWSLKIKLNCELQMYYPDADGDTYGANTGYIYSCTDTIGFVLSNTDCNDIAAEINPSIITDICNNIDDNCNGLLDEDATVLIWYIDTDADGFGNNLIDSITCFELPGYVFDNTDCNDTNNLINPGASETCNTFDDNCNLTIDEDLTFTTYYIDADGDNYGNAEIDSLWCTVVTGYTPDSTDCDDTNPNIYPGADEILNELDDNCNTFIDDGVATEELNVHSMKIYPNPTKHLLFIEWSNEKEEAFQILNNAGEVVSNFISIYPKQQIDVSNYPSGIYLIKTTNEETGLKFMKE